MIRFKKIFLDEYDFLLRTERGINVSGTIFMCGEYGEYKEFKNETDYFDLKNYNMNKFIHYLKSDRGVNYKNHPYYDVFKEICKVMANDETDLEYLYEMILKDSERFYKEYQSFIDGLIYLYRNGFLVHRNSNFDRRCKCEECIDYFQRNDMRYEMKKNECVTDIDNMLNNYSRGFCFSNLLKDFIYENNKFKSVYEEHYYIKTISKFIRFILRNQDKDVVMLNRGFENDQLILKFLLEYDSVYVEKNLGIKYRRNDDYSKGYYRSTEFNLYVKDKKYRIHSFYYLILDNEFMSNFKKYVLK